MSSPEVRNNFDLDADKLIFDIVTPEFILDVLIKATKKMTSERREVLQVCKPNLMKY